MRLFQRPQLEMATENGAPRTPRFGRMCLLTSYALCGRRSRICTQCLPSAPPPSFCRDRGCSGRGGCQRYALPSHVTLTGCQCRASTRCARCSRTLPPVLVTRRKGAGATWSPGCRPFPPSTGQPALAFLVLTAFLPCRPRFRPPPPTPRAYSLLLHVLLIAPPRRLDLMAAAVAVATVAMVARGPAVVGVAMAVEPLAPAAVGSAGRAAAAVDVVVIPSTVVDVAATTTEPAAVVAAAVEAAALPAGAAASAKEPVVAATINATNDFDADTSRWSYAVIHRCRPCGSCILGRRTRGTVCAENLKSAYTCVTPIGVST